MATLTFEDIKNTKLEQLKKLSSWDQIKAPGLHSSMSMSDLVSHLEHRISEQSTPNNPTLSSEEWQSLQILDDINRCLFSDTQHLTQSDEKSLMSRVNSLCCLLQKDSNLSTVQKGGDESDGYGAPAAEKNDEDERENAPGKNQEAAMSKKDSVGDLLLNLPRIASLPQFLFNISEDFENRAR